MRPTDARARARSARLRGGRGFRSARLIALTAVVLTALPAVAGASLRQDVLRAAHAGTHGAALRVSALRTSRSWAFGYVLATPRAAKRGDGGAAPIAFLAHRRGSRWAVAFQGSAAFLRDLRRAPNRVVPALVRKLDLAAVSTPSVQLGGSGPSGAPQFSLPWAAGQTWSLWFGPHNTNSDSGPHPFTSLDFAGGDGLVRAAADGVAYRPCGNLVVIDHGGGWETGYYHLPGIRVGNGQLVHRGDVLGSIGTATGCGGYAHGAHVHFSIYHFSVGGVRNVFQTPSQDMDGVVIGGWVIHDGARSGLGYMQRLSDGQIVYPADTRGTGAIYNDGTVGGWKPPTPSGWHTLAAVSIFAGPGIPYQIVGSLPNGSGVNITCQTKGTPVNGSAIWDQIAANQYVADYYVNTPAVGQFSPGIPVCPSSTPSPSPAGGGGSAPPTSGSGSGSTSTSTTPAPAPGTTPTPPPPAPTFYVHHVYGTCRDGACGLKVHTAPSLSAPVTHVIADGTEVDVVCQARGDMVSNGHASSNVWDKQTDGSWVSDFYIDTPNVGTWSPPIPQC